MKQEESLPLLAKAYKAAGDYIMARVRKDEARKARNAVQCLSVDCDEDGSPCFRHVAPEDPLTSEWCSACERRQKLHDEFLRRSNEAAGKLRKAIYWMQKLEAE